MERSTNVATRVPVSLRIPASIASEVDAYAEKSGIRRTDALLHFLRLGLEAEGGGAGDRLRRMEAQLDELLSLVREEARPSPEEILESARGAVSEVAATYPAIRKAYLFGSVARGEADAGSDIDVRLIVDRAKRFNLHDLEHFCKDVERRTGREVDAVTSQAIKNENLAAAIERDKVLAYEREEH